jgi:D-aminopeptidase
METDSAPRPRLRDLGITVGTMPVGRLNAITDVPGVRVGHATVIEGDSVRTGVTAIHPHEGSVFHEQIPAAIDVLNGAGEITGRALVDEYGVLGSPVLITNTLSVGEVHRGAVDWLVAREPAIGPKHWVAPVVAETYDGYLNDCAGQHVTREHVFAALDGARDGAVDEGCVGGGTGMMLFGLKGGIGTASRVVSVGGREYALGVLVQGNFGALPDLRVDGVPVGRELQSVSAVSLRREPVDAGRDGSIIVVIATDAPLSERQLGRLCRRGMLGLGRVGSHAHHGSGDLLLAFSNAAENRIALESDDVLLRQAQLRDTAINGLFQATVEATEEAVLNAMVAARTMTGRDGHTVEALPHGELREIMARHGRGSG